MEHSADFGRLSPAEQEAVRQAQRERKLAKQQAKKETQLAQKQQRKEEEPAQMAAPAGDLLSAAPTYPTRISMDGYFGACPGGVFRDPGLPPTEESLALLMRVLQAGDAQAKDLNTCCYFQFSGSYEAVWDATFNARLAWEGFFTITTEIRGKKAQSTQKEAREPLPELQPFYGVLTWPNFHAAKHVRTHLGRLRRRMGLQPPTTQPADTDVAASGSGSGGARGLRLVDSADRRQCWEHLEAYHGRGGKDGGKSHCSNWLNEQYFEMMVAASDNPAINFRMHTVLLVEDTTTSQPGDGDEAVEAITSQALAGEIGFSVGRVYTSLSGWTGSRTTQADGTTQLVLLGLWLEAKGYSFWSLGHCYSPELEYKRALGHRIYPRWEFIRLLRQYRGAFLAGATPSAPGDDDRHSCAYCGVIEPATVAAADAFKACSRCGLVWYCGKQCQLQHWKAKGNGGHKVACVPKDQQLPVADSSSAVEFAPLTAGQSVTANELLHHDSSG